MSAATPNGRYSWLYDAIDGEAEVVTASRRLARELAAAYAGHRIAVGDTAWPTPAIAFWQDWLAQKLASTADPTAVPRRIDAFSSNVLWERALAAHLPDGVLNRNGVVRQAVRSWQRVSEWNVTLAALQHSARNQDERMFARAAADYRDRLERGNWIDDAGLADVVAGLLAREPALVPKRLMVVGFDRLSPAVEMILAALQAGGCAVQPIPAAQRSGAVRLATFERQAGELRAAGAWAQRALEAAPEAKIAIVCPGLETNAEEVARLVREGLVPGWQQGDSRHFFAANVSYGRRLVDYPAVAIALLVLRWTVQGLTGSQLSVLLRSRCVASQEIPGRCRLELHLRSFPDRRWTAAGFLSALEGSDKTADATAFCDLARTVAGLSAEVDAPSTPPECVRRVDALLDAVSWPGDAPLDSVAFQLINRWRELLNEFARVESVLPQVTFSSAITRIAALAADCLWQPETEPGVVQVMGALEAAGLEFDHIWISGMDASKWPPPSRPSPLVSQVLQRKHGMPDATPDDTLEFSRRVFARLTGAADHCVLSWARMQDDAELAASSLIDPAAVEALEDVTDAGWYALALTGTGKTSCHAVDPPPAVRPAERVSGGAYTVQQQFDEPFSAFVHGRLGVRTVDAFCPGLPPRIRGSIIHSALYNLLASKPSQDQIRAWSTGESERNVGSAIDSALGRHIRHADAVIMRILGLERTRLRNLLHRFLAEECARADFFVAELEHQLQYERFGVRLSLRVDRVDRLADGRQLVIDYKTGAPKHFLRQDGELKDVQLVVYADALGSDVGGLLFVNVDSRAIIYRGVGGGWNEAEAEEWPRTLQHWRAEVHQALKSLAAGDVRINTVQSPAEARQLAILSRIEEQRRAR